MNTPTTKEIAEAVSSLYVNHHSVATWLSRIVTRSGQSDDGQVTIHEWRMDSYLDRAELTVTFTVPQGLNMQDVRALNYIAANQLADRALPRWRRVLKALR